MKAFWLTYALATIALVAYCCSFLVHPFLCAIVITGAAASSSFLVYKRRRLMQQRYLVPVALVASVASVAVGFIVMFLIGAAGEIFR
jgi:hypothetical protein